MICVRCSLNVSGDQDYFICNDCIAFSKIIKDVFFDVHSQLEQLESIDPDTHPIFQLLSDSTFLTSKNPQTAIFYKMSDFLISKAFSGIFEITEEELNRNVLTTRGWSPAFRIFEELNLIDVRLERYRRVLILTDKTKKFALQYYQTDRLSDIGLRTRLAHIYSGYVLLYILTKVANLTEKLSNKESIPYNKIPRTLWIVLMYLWSNAYNDSESFREENFIKFVAKRRMPSATRGRILNAFQAMDGRSTQGLIKGIEFDNGERIFTFEDYALREMTRIRELVRERERT